MSREYVELLQSVLPDAGDYDLTRPFDELGVDSFDLLSIRVEFERVIGIEIPDSFWTEFRTFQDLFDYAHDAGPDSGATAAIPETIHGVHYARDFELGMPQMAIGALSEGWLFKELGNAHWELLCRGLGTRSRDLADELGNRLYATFARVQHVGNVNLAQFEESEPLRLTGEISRFGGGMYYSEFTLSAVARPHVRIDARLITSFSRRGETGNRGLVKSVPATSTNAIANRAEAPAFIDEYRMVKKGSLNEVTVGSEHFSQTDDVLHQSEYLLNPYHDLNGVGLLYFAAYPIISDTCEARYFNDRAGSMAGWWEQRWSAASRDVMYYANCDIADTVVYRLHSLAESADKISLAASLSRKSDNALMARIFVTKTRVSADLG